MQIFLPVQKFNLHNNVERTVMTNLTCSAISKPQNVEQKVLYINNSQYMKLSQQTTVDCQGQGRQLIT